MIRVTVLTLCLVCALATAGTATAASSAWKPGTPYFVTEAEMESLLTDTFDFATCFGIKRYGHVGGDAYLRFRCSFEWRGQSCYRWDFVSLKGKKPGFYKSKAVRQGSCY